MQKLSKYFTRKFKNRLQFFIFQNRINKKTWDEHDSVLQWALDQAEAEHHGHRSDAMEQRGIELRDKVLSEYHNKFVSLRELRILIHIPSKESSPGGYSLFSNLAYSLKYIGIQTDILEWDESITQKLDTFKPTVFMTSDSENYLQRIDWISIEHYRINNSLRIGLTASIEAYGNTPLSNRMRWAKKNSVDFYYSFRAPEYLTSRPDYRPFFEEGYKILSVEFGANPLLYFPVGGTEKDLDYIFLASSNRDKQRRYFDWLPPIVNHYKGFIDGPGWSKITRWAPQPAHRFLYARAKVGLNLHIDDSIEWASELNERTYILAACGIPQLVDNARLLPMRFSKNAMFIANTPKEYAELFDYIIRHSLEAQKRTLVALEEVLSKHTTLHRAESLVRQLLNRI